MPEGEPGRYMDPLTKDALTNASKLVVLKKTGDVLLKDTYTKLVKPDGVFNGGLGASPKGLRGGPSI